MRSSREPLIPLNTAKLLFFLHSYKFLHGFLSPFIYFDAFAAESVTPSFNKSRHKTDKGLTGLFPITHATTNGSSRREPYAIPPAAICGPAGTLMRAGGNSVGGSDEITKYHKLSLFPAKAITRQWTAAAYYPHSRISTF